MKREAWRENTRHFILPATLDALCEWSKGMAFLQQRFAEGLHESDGFGIVAVNADGADTAFAQQPQGQPSFKWWQSEQFQKDLGLTPDQVARIDAIFQATLPELRQRKDELDVLETRLSRLIVNSPGSRLCRRLFSPPLRNDI